jgi:hypothetical protein
MRAHGSRARSPPRRRGTPFPFAPTAGLGWRSGNLKIDFALYAHTVMSMSKDSVSPAADLSLSMSF